MKTSMDIIIRHDGVYSWNFYSNQNVPLVCDSLNCLLKNVVRLTGKNSGSFRIHKMEMILSSYDIKSACLKHYHP